MSDENKISQYKKINQTLDQAIHLYKQIQELKNNSAAEQEIAIKMQELAKLMDTNDSMDLSGSNEKELILAELRQKFGNLPDEELIKMEIEANRRRIIDFNQEGLS